MKENNYRSFILQIIAIILIFCNLIAYAVYWYTPTFEEGLIDFLLQFLVLYLNLFLCIIPTFLLGFLLSRFKLKHKYGIGLKKGVVISSILIYSLTIIYPLRFIISNRKIKIVPNNIETYNSKTNNLIIYEFDNIELLFNKSDIISFCNNKFNENPNFEYLKTFKVYIDSSDSNLTIKREYVFLPDTFELVKNYESKCQFDTVFILDKSAKMNSYIDAIDYASIELLRNGKFKIYDMKEKVFIDYIYYQQVSDPLGNLDLYCYLPNGRKFFDRRLLWGL